MKVRHHKSRRGTAGLPPLPPEHAAALKDQLARLKSALAAGEAPAELMSPSPQDLAWDLHLISGLAKLPTLTSLPSWRRGLEKPPARTD